MKNNKIMFILISFVFFCCSQNKKSSPIEHKVVQDVKKSKSNKEFINDTLAVIIDKNIVLKWNTKRNDFIKDNNFYAYLIDKQALQRISENILSEYDLNVKVCTKGQNLKTGDIAFLYLWKNQKIYLFNCLKIQFDVVDENCKIPEGLLDYLDKNRKKVHDSIIECINK